MSPIDGRCGLSPGDGRRDVSAEVGACMALRGIDGVLPFLSVSGEDAACIRRIMLGHFREPLDLNPSPNGEGSALFAAGDEAKMAEAVNRYKPVIVGCVCDEKMRSDSDDLECDHIAMVQCVGVNSLKKGFTQALCAVLESYSAQLDEGTEKGNHINVFAGLVSPADLRYLKEILGHFGIDYTLYPDYSETLDGPSVAAYEPVLDGGTTLKSIARMSSARISLTLGSSDDGALGPGAWLEQHYGVEHHVLGLPVGLKATDALVRELENLSGRAVPPKHDDERSRLVDAYVEAHKYLSGVRVMIHAWSDLAVGMAVLLAEVGAEPVVVASAGGAGNMKAEIRRWLGRDARDMEVIEGLPFSELDDVVMRSGADLIVGSSAAYRTARHCGVPLVRVGFPVLDRLGGQRYLHLGYLGAQQLFDRLVNTVIGFRQDHDDRLY